MVLKYIHYKSIAIDFCIEFRNSTFPPVLEFTEEILLTASARAFSNGANPRCVAVSVLKLFKFFLRPTQLGYTIVVLLIIAFLNYS